MFIKDYLNHEKDIDVGILKIKNYEFCPKCKIDVENVPEGSIYLFFNIGHIMQFKLRDFNILCPSKNGFFGKGKIPGIIYNPGHHYKFAVLSLSNDFSAEIEKKILRATDKRFHSIFTKSYCFSLALNIEIFQLIEDIYRSGWNENLNFSTLEIEAKFLHLLAVVLRTILFENYKFNGITSSPTLKYYWVLKMLFDKKSTFQEALTTFEITQHQFKDLFCYFNPDLDYNKYIAELTQK